MKRMIRWLVNLSSQSILPTSGKSLLHNLAAVLLEAVVNGFCKYLFLCVCVRVFIQQIKNLVNIGMNMTSRYLICHLWVIDFCPLENSSNKSNTNTKEQSYYPTVENTSYSVNGQ